MVRKCTLRGSARFAAFIVAFLLGAPILTTAAQGNGPHLIQTAEYDIGFNCPVASALDPTGAILWVLMDNCFQSDFALHAYNVADGSQINKDDYADALVSLAGLDMYVDPFITPLAFTPEGDLSIWYADIQTDESFNVTISSPVGAAAF